VNIILEIVRYFIIIIIGIVSIKWFERKKGWEYSFIKSFLFIFCWKTIMLSLMISTNLLLDLFLLEVFSNISELFIIYPIMLVVVSLFINILIGVIILVFVYNQKIQESIVIILIIVIIEMILESVLLYSSLILESIIT